MADHFDAVDAALAKIRAAHSDTHDALVAAHEQLVIASATLREGTDELNQALEASRAARGEQEDLRETTARLETLVMDLVGEVRELRRRQNGGTAP